MKPLVLIVDDEPPIQELIRYNLEREGYRTEVIDNGEDVLSFVATQNPALVILDVMLPRLDGLSVCRSIRKEYEVPVIMLTARKEESDRVLGLELGADDYLTKPFSIRELIARVRAILRRSHKEVVDTKQGIRFGDVFVDESGRTVTKAGELVDLTYTEFELLQLLLQNRGRVLSREVLLDKIWGSDYFGDARTVDVHIRHLREKIEKDPGKPEFIETVRGVGYRFRQEHNP